MKRRCHKCMHRYKHRVLVAWSNADLWESKWYCGRFQDPVTGLNRIQLLWRCRLIRLTPFCKFKKIQDPNIGEI